MQKETNIICPKCGNEIDVNEILYHQLEDDFKKKYTAQLADVKQEYETRFTKLQEEKKQFEKVKKEINEKIEFGVKEKLKTEKISLEKKIKERVQEEIKDEFNEKIKILEDENTKRKEENTTLKKKELDLLKREQEIKEEKENMQLEIEKQIFEKREEVAEEIRKKEEEKNEFKFRVLQKKLDDQIKLSEEMKRKAEQGSMQMQGEIQELALEDMLNAQFPFDIIEEVPKGVKGADVIQTVINPLQQVCGKIIYESKRTKSFSDGWIDKLKEDQLNQQADLSMIITETMPKDLERFDRKNGVWICSFQEAKGVAFVLREMILKTHSVKSTEENKGDKKELLYKYLISEEFRQGVEAIVEGFSGLKIDLDKEKRAMQKIWKTREKQIEKVISNTIDFYGSIKGIAGTSIQTVKALELPEPKEDFESEE